MLSQTRASFLKDMWQLVMNTVQYYNFFGQEEEKAVLGVLDESII